MAVKKNFMVLGLGSFGSALAQRLSHNGCRVSGFDKRRDCVEALKDVLYEAVIGDVTERSTFEGLHLENYDAIFISLGENQNISPSVLATLHCRELGARRVIVKGLTPDHERILRKLGVERVVFPETEMAVSLADQFAWPNILDFMPIDPEYNFVEITVPETLIGQTLKEADLRRVYNIWVVGIKDALHGKLALFPDAEYRLGVDQIMVVVAKREDIDRFRRLA